MTGRRLFAVVLISICAMAPAMAQKFVYGSDFDYLFDNREFDVAGEKYMQSQTFHTAILRGEAGLSFNETDRTVHKIILGGSVVRDFSGSFFTDKNFFEASLYYMAAFKESDGRYFEAVAGAYPRALIKGRYSRAMWSDAYAFHDVNKEGVLLRYGKGGFDAELGCDWMGSYGPNSRERFQVFSSGSWTITRDFSAGWSGSFYHFATSQVAKNVIDNHLLAPWLKYDLSRLPLQELSLQAFLLAGYQRSREIDRKAALPLGAEFIFRAKKWNVCLQNSLYTGDNLLVYYDYPAPEGGTYASNLYLGETTYKGFYDRVELIWAPNLTKEVKLEVVAAFHYDATGYQGCQQIVRLCSMF